MWEQSGHCGGVPALLASSPEIALGSVPLVTFKYVSIHCEISLGGTTHHGASCPIQILSHSWPTETSPGDQDLEPQLPTERCGP